MTDSNYEGQRGRGAVMLQDKARNDEIIDSSEMHPQHESWVPITNRSSMLGCLFALALVAVFWITIHERFDIGSFVVLGVLAVPFLAWRMCKGSGLLRRGPIRNAVLKAEIRSDLDTELDAVDVHVHGSIDEITLTGIVPYSDFKAEAEHIARRRGADRVVNELEAAADGSGAHDTTWDRLPAVTTPEGAPEVETRLPLDEQVRSALAHDPRIHEHVLFVNVADGIAYLTGRQETVQASEAATQVALHVPGILGVSNDIEILPSV